MTALDDYRSTRRHTLELVAGFSQSRIDHRPGPGKWSLGQVLDHLIRIDELFRDEIAELVKRAGAGKGGILFRGFDHFGVLGVRRAVPNVVHHRVVEQQRVLPHEADLLP